MDLSAGEFLRLWFSHPLNWGVVAFLLASSIVVHTKDNQDAALVFLLLGWQVTLLEIALGTYYCWAYPPTHAKTEDIVAGFRFAPLWCVPTLLLSLPVIALTWKPGFRQALKKRRWSIAALLVTVADVALLILGSISLAGRLPDPWP